LNFLIDECLHLSLVQVAEAHGHEATHVCYRGLGGTQDWNLMPIIIEESFTFVTNNAADFLRLFQLEEAHAGLIVLIPNVEPKLQRELFDAVLDELGNPGDLFNQAIKVWFSDEERTEIESERLDLSLPEEE
jgi:predicted nuclease of predicted toxin-antitoxin system